MILKVKQVNINKNGTFELKHNLFIKQPINIVEANTVEVQNWRQILTSFIQKFQYSTSIK